MEQPELIAMLEGCLKEEEHGHDGGALGHGLRSLDRHTIEEEVEAEKVQSELAETELARRKERAYLDRDGLVNARAALSLNDHFREDASVS
jgi:hypothetical protein